MNKHTPGPLAGYKFTIADGPLGQMVSVTAPDGKDLGSCGGGSEKTLRHRAEELAYADFGRRFAPDLLEACEAFVKAARYLPPVVDSAVADAINRADAAIRKARP